MFGIANRKKKKGERGPSGERGECRKASARKARRKKKKKKKGVRPVEGAGFLKFDTFYKIPLVKGKEVPHPKRKKSTEEGLVERRLATTNTGFSAAEEVSEQKKREGNGGTSNKKTEF